MLTWKLLWRGINTDIYDEIIGKIAVCDIMADTVLQDRFIK